jgi:hypothetical protein
MPRRPPLSVPALTKTQDSHHNQTVKEAYAAGPARVPRASVCIRLSVAVRRTTFGVGVLLASAGLGGLVLGGAAVSAVLSLGPDPRDRAQQRQPGPDLVLARLDHRLAPSPVLLGPSVDEAVPHVLSNR